jgi:uncharacterized damage-inducible protein DinB
MTGIAELVAEVVDYSINQSHAHKPMDALDGWATEDLTYEPVPQRSVDWDGEWTPGAVPMPRRIMAHTIDAAYHYADGLAGLRDSAGRAGWGRERMATIADEPESLIAALHAALDHVCERVADLSDHDLDQPARETWGGTASKALVALEGGILHPAWHLGQIAMLQSWRQAEVAGFELVPPGGQPNEFPYPADRARGLETVATRHQVCRLVANRAFDGSPTLSLRPVVASISEAELAWKPFPEIDDPWWCKAGWTQVLHTWSPKLVYIDHALGDRKLQYGEESSALVGGAWGDTDPQRQLGALDRTHEIMLQRLDAATDEDLRRVNPMHIDHPMTGWQAVVCMAQHDSWHAGQLALMRDVAMLLHRER